MTPTSTSHRANPVKPQATAGAGQAPPVALDADPSVRRGTPPEELEETCSESTTSISTAIATWAARGLACGLTHSPGARRR